MPVRLPELRRRRAGLILENLREKVPVPEMQLFGNVINAHPRRNEKIRSMLNPRFLDVGVDAHAGFCFEFLGEVIPAVSDPVRQDPQKDSGRPA